MKSVDPGPLSVQGLRKSYANVVALDGVDLSVQSGQLLGFLGPNGAGKTTTMRAIMGLTAVDGGLITWNGETMPIDDRSGIGYMPQERGLYARMRVHEHIAYIGRIAGLDAATANSSADYWIDRVGLSDRRDANVQELSTGNQQRVQLAIALVHQPELLILDEPFAGLDPIAVTALTDVMYEQVTRGAAVIFSSHQLDVVQDLAEHVTIIAQGKTRLTGTVSDLRHNSPHRILEIDWADGGAEPPQWVPKEGSVATVTAGRSRFVVPAQTDASALIASASEAALIASVSFQPPTLEEVFLETVGQ